MQVPPGAFGTRRFRELYGDQFLTVRDYFETVRDRVEIVDLAGLVPGLTTR